MRVVAGMVAAQVLPFGGMFDCLVFFFGGYPLLFLGGWRKPFGVKPLMNYGNLADVGVFGLDPNVAALWGRVETKVYAGLDDAGENEKEKM